MANVNGGRHVSTQDIINPLLDLLRLNLPSRYLLLEDELLTLVVGFLLLVGFIIGSFVVVLLRTRTRLGNAIVLCGPTSAGKTVLWFQLRFKETVPTVMSLVENTATLPLSEGGDVHVEIIDLPGHERLRYKSADFLPLARAVVFVVDSAGVIKDIRTVAESLYNVLVHPHISKQAIPVLVACNKSDLTTAQSPTQIRSLLEDELDKLRATRSATLETQDVAGITAPESDAYLGYDGKTFSFDDLPNPVDLEAVSALNGEVGSIQEWISEVAR